MCKILVMAGITEKTREKAWPVILGMADEMSFGNNDGLGYASISEDGSMASERWLFNRKAFRERDPVSEHDKDLIDKYMGFLEKETTYDHFTEAGDLGISNQSISSIIMHARFATSGKEFFNTHPFSDLDNKTSLIHNGVISNVEELEYKQSSCDSEGILNAYLEEGINENPKHVQRMASQLQGSYACGVLSRDSIGTPIVDVFKNSYTSLNGAFVEELQVKGQPPVMIFTTSIRDLEDVCKKLKYTIKSEFMCAGGVLLRMNALTGEVMTSVRFQPEYKARVKDGKEYPKQNKLIVFRKFKAEQERDNWYNKYNNNGKVCNLPVRREDSGGIERYTPPKRGGDVENFKQRMEKMDKFSRWHRIGSGVWSRKNESSA